MSSEIQVGERCDFDLKITKELNRVNMVPLCPVYSEFLVTPATTTSTSNNLVDALALVRIDDRLQDTGQDSVLEPKEGKN